MSAAVGINKKTALSGIKPTGTPHIGNYLGMIRPALKLTETFRPFYFIADYHALTVIRDAESLRHLSRQVAATLLALGLDPEQVVFYRQSDIPEIFELTWVLSCFTPKGLLNRAHAYKAAVDQNEAQGNNQDDGINAGLYNYPVLMAADILLFNTEVVPVGQDQKQHIEIARDVASAFNHTYGDILVLPEASIVEDVKTVPGLDGRKMSKSYGNTIELFAPSKQLRQQVMKIVTDSRSPEEPKDPDENNVYNIYKHFATPEQDAAMRDRFVKGGLGYGHVKQELFELLDTTFGQAREDYHRFMDDPAELDRTLQQGAETARDIASQVMDRVRSAVGMR